MSPEEIAHEYFRRMQARDPAVVELFAEDAELRGLGNRVVGKAAVREFYENAQRDASPRPEPVAVVADGDRVLAEARIHLADGTVMHVVDVFEVHAERIRSLTYFTSDYPALEG